MEDQQSAMDVTMGDDQCDIDLAVGEEQAHNMRDPKSPIDHDSTATLTAPFTRPQMYPPNAIFAGSTLPDLRPRTHIFGLGGVTSSEVSPDKDGWLLSEFFLIQHLFKDLGASRYGSRASSPKICSKDLVNTHMGLQRGRDTWCWIRIPSLITF
jgi:hypothetical protein